MDLVVDRAHGAPYMMKPRTGIIAYILFGEDAALDFRVDRGQGFQQPEEFLQRVLRQFRVFMASIGFNPG